MTTAFNIFPDNVSEATTAAAIETWLDGLSINQLTKIKAFHRYGFYRVVVYYDPVKWQNTCEDTSLWTVDAAITATLDTSDPKEGSNSIKFVNNDAASGDIKFYPTSITNPGINHYFGFWIKIVNPPTGFDLYVRKYKTSNANYEAIRFYLSGADLIYRPRTKGSPTGTWGNAETISSGTWYWCEMRDNGGNHYFWRNGSLRQTITSGACDITDYDVIDFLIPDTKKLGEVHVDWLGIRSYEVYPP
jgi:hypothetical protein